MSTRDDDNGHGDHAQRLTTLGTLIAGLAHEFSNVATHLRFALHDIELRATRLAERTGVDATDLQSAIGPAVRSAERGVELARVVTAYARSTPATITIVDIHSVLDDALDLVRYKLSGRMRLIVHVDPDLPMVRASERELYQVFVNLLINALHAIEREPIPAEQCLHVQARGNAATAEISVRDTGCGIAPEHVGRIFDPYFTTRSDNGGTGLGLPLCRRVVEAAGGTLEVTSALGAGSTFTIRLPSA